MTSYSTLSPQSERKILTEALEDFNQVDMEELIDVLSDQAARCELQENILR